MPHHFDHLVVAATKLADGISHVERLIGVAPRPGGQHVFMGTHNALLRLGDSCYLEVIAIDPALPAPSRPRWFGLDDQRVQWELAVSPRLLHWVVRTVDISASSASVSRIVGPVVAASRGNLHWKITIPETGTLPLQGAFPTFIQWDNAEHVASKMPDLGCGLQELIVTHPDAIFMGKTLAMQDDRRLRFETGPVAKLVATITTPAGPRRLY